MNCPHKDLTVFLTAVDEAVESLDDLFEVHFVRPPRLAQDMLVFFHPGPQSCHLHTNRLLNTVTSSSLGHAQCVESSGPSSVIKNWGFVCLRHECGNNKNYIQAKVYRNLVNVRHQQQAG